VTRNKDDCIELTESIYGLIYAIVRLHLNSETPGSLPPAMMHHIGKFTESSAFSLTLLLYSLKLWQDPSQNPHFRRGSTKREQDQTFLPPERNEHTAWGMSSRIKGGSRRFSGAQCLVVWLYSTHDCNRFTRDLRCWRTPVRCRKKWNPCIKNFWN
jgi:hypothetical protein